MRNLFPPLQLYITMPEEAVGCQALRKAREHLLSLELSELGSSFPIVAARSLSHAGCQKQVGL